MVRSLIAGGYEEKGARGIYPLGGAQDLVAGEPAARIRNVSGGVNLPGTSRWYFVDESASEIVLVDTASWHELARVPSGGTAPCHLALNNTATLLAVANYESGTTALFQLATDGAPVEPPLVQQHTGSGPVPERQEGPHAHWVGFAANRLLYVADLGIDRVLAFDMDAASGHLGVPQDAYVAPPGSGPRQLAFHPRLPIAYLVSEMNSTLTVLRIEEDGTLTARQILSTLPSDAGPGSLGGAIALDAHMARIYVSNRGHDSIATFAIGDDGDVDLLGYATSGGSSPRFLLIEAERLLVAHEKSGGVTALPLNNRGLPGAVNARADVPGAAFLGVLT